MAQYVVAVYLGVMVAYRPARCALIGYPDMKSVWRENLMEAIR